MIKIQRFFTNLFIVFILCLSNASASGIQSYLDELNTLTADYLQTHIEVSSGIILKQSGGQFKLLRPGNMIINSSEQQTIVYKGKLAVVDNDLEQVTILPLVDMKDDIPLNWLLYKEPIDKRFNITETNQKDLIWASLTPKYDTFFKSVEITILKGEMREIIIYENNGNLVKIDFNNIKFNPPISQDVFRIPTVNGFDVIGDY